MNIQKVLVTASAMSYPCLACGKMINGLIETVLADLDGPAFMAYYHKECLPRIDISLTGKQEEKWTEE